MLLLIDFKLIDFVILLSKIVISLVAINAAFEKYFLTKVTQMERIILFIGGFLLMFMDNYLALVGLIGIVAIAFQQFKKSKTEL